MMVFYDQDGKRVTISRGDIISYALPRACDVHKAVVTYIDTSTILITTRAVRNFEIRSAKDLYIKEVALSAKDAVAQCSHGRFSYLQKVFGPKDSSGREGLVIACFNDELYVETNKLHTHGKEVIYGRLEQFQPMDTMKQAS